MLTALPGVTSVEQAGGRVVVIARGSTNREAAKRLYLSETTVKTHLPHVYAKLGVNDRAAAVAAASPRGDLTPEP